MSSVTKYKLIEFKNILRISLSLAKANFSLRMEGSYLGIFWYLLNPLASFFIILFIRNAAFSNVAIAHYPIYLFMGITGFNFFRQAISNSIRAITTNVDYIKSMNNIAPEVLVLSVVFQALFSHIFEFILISGFVLYGHIAWIYLIFYPLVFIWFFLLTIGIALIFATIGVYINDLDNLWNIFAQLLFLVTPIFYAVGVGSPVYIVNLFNPLFYFLEIARSLVIYATIPPLWMILIMVVSSPSLFFIGCFIFNRHKRRFAELI